MVTTSLFSSRQSTETLADLPSPQLSTAAVESAWPAVGLSTVIVTLVARAKSLVASFTLPLGMVKVRLAFVGSVTYASKGTRPTVYVEDQLWNARLLSAPSAFTVTVSPAL